VARESAMTASIALFLAIYFACYFVWDIFCMKRFVPIRVALFATFLVGFCVLKGLI
jgi:hypothetical protein